ncbi:hypothetical protein, partial [Pseudomonas sp. DC418]|uniref:hypothetical protein n=1 Tax=Pseudomonas sp. DC418 TaxID=3418478 RepID=UPI003D2DF067
RGKVEAGSHSGRLLMHVDCDERACARARHLVGAALASLGSGRGGRREPGSRALCIYVLSNLYTKHEHTKASSMPDREQLSGSHYFEINRLKYNFMK